MPQPLEILYEDNHCLVVDKPAGLLVQGDITDDLSLVDLVRADLKARYHKPGNVFVGLLHRLDRPVSGVVLVAKTSKAAARLSADFREGRVKKTYLAVVEGRLPGESGEFRDGLRKDAVRNVVSAVPEGSPESLLAITRYRRLDVRGGRTLAELEPVTGRPHQLRVQLASRGLPIVGDRKYGARSRLACAAGGERLALHAATLRFNHPTRREAIEVSAPVPADWPAGAWASGSGSPSD